MRKKAPLVFLALAMVLAAVAAYGAQIWINSYADQVAAKRVVLTKVVVAAREFSPGQVLEMGDLRLANWPKAARPGASFLKLRQLKGRVVKYSLGKGQVVLDGNLQPKGMAGGLASVVPEGYRAMTVRVDEVVGVGGFVQPGDRVDVILTAHKGPYSDNPASRTVVEDVAVLTVGGRVMAEKSSKPKTRKIRVVTLKLRPVQAEKLALSANEGKVILALRNHGDRGSQSTKGVRLTSLLPPPTPKETVKEQAQAAVGAAAESVEVIKGSKRSLQTL